ncbi:ABC transporter G family member 22 [Dorcoceras hygrometricum]|uniref:ABC transporter G family member 22 n=1 Tax=Dorcoceras hygrometricum TaxID=472368 RepID=A0A2Z7B582_9LAMI|nr:ABC transporter G family member 22 [Dorcoceras hygrometricum]
MKRRRLESFGSVCNISRCLSVDLYRVGYVVPEKSNAIVGVVTTGFECLPPSCDGLTGPDDHGPMISRLIDRGVSGNQAGPSGSSVGRSPHP